MLTERWAQPTRCWGKKFLPWLKNWRKRDPNTRRGGDGGGSQDARVPRGGCENHHFTRSFSKPARRLRVKAGWSPPEEGTWVVNSAVPSCPIRPPPLPGASAHVHLAIEPPPWLGALVLLMHTAVSSCRDRPQCKEHDTPGHTKKWGFFIVTTFVFFLGSSERNAARKRCIFYSSWIFMKLQFSVFLSITYILIF